MSLEDLYRISNKHGIKFSFEVRANSNDVIIDLYGDRKKIREARQEIYRNRPLGTKYIVRNNSMFKYHVMSIVWKISKTAIFKN